MVTFALGLGLGLGPGQVPAGRGQGAPVPLAPPVLAGPGRIGAEHRLDPGLWQGAEALVVAWLRDGVPIPGADGLVFRPGPAEDRARLGARVTARGPYGTRSAFSNEFLITHAPPLAAGGLPDLGLVRHSGEHHVDASSDFTGSALTFGVTGEGVSIDPETGLLTITTEGLREGVTVTVTASNSGGAAASRFRLTIAPLPAEEAPGEEPGTAPVLLEAPALAGSGRVGEAVTLLPGAWGGVPAPALAFAWAIDGVVVPEAAGPSFVPGPAEDGRLLTARVTATNAAGTAATETAPLAVTEVPPAAVAALADVAYAAGSGVQVVEAAPAFAGASLVFAVTGPGATIDAASGRVTLATTAAVAAGLVTVTATNSGGSATASFAVTVAAAPQPQPEPETPLVLALGPGNAELVLLPDLDPDQTGLHLGLRIIDARHPLHPAAAGTGHLAWTDAAPEGRNPVTQAAKAVRARRFATAGDPQYGVWALTRRTNGGTVAWADRSTQIGDTHVLAFNWAGDDPGAKTAGEAAWTGWGPRFPAFTITAPAAPQPEPQPDPAPQPDPKPEPVLAPALLAAPALAGSGVIGTEVTADPGLWSGAPALALQWRRDGAAIPGATAALYVPGPADDRCALTCAVTATNAGGSAGAVTAALAVAYAPPRATGTLFDEVFDEDTGAQTVEAAPAFTGEDLTFAVTGAGATVEPRTGRIAIPTATPVSGETVRVTAANSGGEATLAFLVTVEAAEAAAPLPVPVTPEIAELVLLADLDPEQSGLHLGLRIRDAAHPLHPAAGGTGHLAWTGLATAGRDPATQAGKAVRARRFAQAGDPQYGVWALTRRNNGGLADWADRATQFGDAHALAFAYSTDDPAIVPAGNALWEAWGPVFPAFTFVDPNPAAPPVATAAQNARFPWRTEEEYQASLAGPYEGGDGGQLMTGRSTCRQHPRFMAWAQDMGAFWLSFDRGQTWWRPRFKGLLCYLSNDVHFDPVNPHRIALLAVQGYPATSGEAGVYLSDDCGMTMSKRLALPDTFKPKMRQNGLCWSEAQVSGGRSQRLYVMVNEPGDTNDSITSRVFLSRSTDGGATFSSPIVDTSGQWGSIFALRAHPTNADVFFVATSTGFWRISWSGGTPSSTNLAGSGGLPSGSYNHIPYLEMVGGNLHIVMYRGSTAHRTTNGSAGTPSWTGALSRSLDKLHISPYHPAHWIGSSGGSFHYSTNSGGSWSTADKSTQTPRPGRNTRDFTQSHHVSEPTFTGVAGEVVFPMGEDGWMRSTNHGATWRDSSDGFTGCQTEQPQANGQRFAANNDQVVATGLTDKSAVVSVNKGRSWRRGPPGIGAAIGVTSGPSSHKSTMRTLSIHPDYGRGMGRDVILGLMAAWTSGEAVICDGLVSSSSSWSRPAGVATGSTRATFVGFDLSNPQWAYMRRSRSNNHGKAGSWSEMSALPSGFEVMGMTRTAPGLSNGQAIFAMEPGNNSLSLVKRSLDRGNTWQDVIDLAAHGVNIAAIVGPTNSLFLPHPSNPNRLFVAGPRTGQGSGSRRTSYRIFDLSSGSVTKRPFQQIDCLPPNIDSQLVQSGRFMLQTMVPDWRFPDTIHYVVNALPGTGVPLIRTTDGGQTWTNLAAFYPDLSVAAIEVSPHTGDVILHGPSGGYIIAPPYAQAGSLTAMAPNPARILSVPPAF